jgi:hypothetical protein
MTCVWIHRRLRHLVLAGAVKQKLFASFREQILDWTLVQLPEGGRTFLGGRLDDPRGPMKVRQSVTRLSALGRRAFCCLLSKCSKHFKYRGVEQLVARLPHKQKVVGSNPAPATR